MRRIAQVLAIAATFLACGISAQAQCPARTTVADTIYNADGSLAAGRVVVAWPTFTIGACQVVAGQASVSVTNGAFSADLYPNMTAVPAGTSYRVSYYLKSGRVTTEYWVVPASASPVAIAAVRSASVPVPTVMFSQSQVTNLPGDLAKKVELPVPCAAGKFLQSNGAAAQPQVNCVDGTGGGGGSGSQHQVNATNLAANDPVNFQNSATIAFSNPSAGNVQASVPDASVTAAKLNVAAPSGAQLSGLGDANIGAAALSPNRIAGTAEVQSNKGAANGYASLDGATKVPAAQLPDATTSAKGVVELAANGESAANLTVQANDSRLSDARAPTAHAATHQHGGADQIATATPAANAIPKADAAGKIADGWLSSNVSQLGPSIDLGSEVTGVLPDSALASNYSGVGSCTNQFARALNDNAAPTCATVQKADAASTFVHSDQANTYSAGLKQTFAPNGTSAGINIGAQAGDPSTLANGDIWYNNSTSKFRCRENGSSKDCIGAAGGSSPLTAKGDLHTFSSADARLPAGSDYQVLKSDSAESTGLKWVDGSTVLDRATTENDVVNTTSETSLYSVTIPANALGTTRMVNVLIFGDYNNTSGGNSTVTLRVKWAGTTIYQDVSANIASASGLRPVRIELSLANLGATNSQFFRGFVEIGVQNNATTGFGDLGSTSAAIRQPIGTTTGLSVDTTAARTLEVTVQHSVANANTSFRRRYALATIQ